MRRFSAVHRFQAVAIAFSLFLILSAVAGCVPDTGAADFAVGVSAVRRQTGEAFAGINALVREDELAQAGLAARVSEEAFTPIFTPAALAKYDRLFEQLQGYADHLAALSSGQPADSFADSWQRFGDSLARVSPNSLPGPGVSAAVTELGRLVVQAKAQRDAVRIARETDPAVQQLCRAMSDLISSPTPLATTTAVETIDTGVRQNVLNHWADRRRAMELAFDGTASPTAEQRQAYAVAYAELLQERDVQLAALDAVRQSFTRLGQAHAALARCDAPALSDAVANISAGLRRTRELLDSSTDRH